MNNETKRIRDQILARRAALVAAAVGSAVAINCSAKGGDEDTSPCLSVRPSCESDLSSDYCNACLEAPHGDGDDVQTDPGGGGAGGESQGGAGGAR